MARSFKKHLRCAFYSLCRELSIGALGCFTAVRYFNVPRLERFGGVLLASNHQSFLDPVLVGMSLERPIHYLARAGLFRTPGFRELITTLGAHPVRRGRVDSRALRTVLDILRGGEPLLMFPEGTRTRDGSVGRFRPGAGSIAARCEVPLIPVCIEGAFRSWPRSRALPRPARVAVAYGDPIRPRAGDGKVLTEQARAGVLEMQERLRAYLGRNARWAPDFDKQTAKRTQRKGT